MLKSEIVNLQQQKNDIISQTQQIIAQGEEANNAVKARQENLMAIDGRVHALRYEEQQLTISIQNKTAERAVKDQELGSITLDIESLKWQKSDLIKTIAELNARNTELIGKAATIQERERACDQREESLKAKYADAGIQYI